MIRKVLMLLVLITIVSCSKEEPKSNKEEPPINYKDSAEELKKAKIIVGEEKDGIKKVDVADLYVSDKSGDYLKFNLEKATWVTGDDWDIAFYSRSIIVNGGNYVVTAKAYATAKEPERTGDAALAIAGYEKDEFVVVADEQGGGYSELAEVPDNILFRQDELGEFAIKEDSSRILSEYNLTPTSIGEHIVSIRNNRFLIIRTHNGHYAKLKIKSLYSNGGKDYNKASDWNDSYNYFPYLTFTYNYNTIKGNKKLK